LWKRVVGWAIVALYSGMSSMSLHITLAGA
jgi:hypothetical protein